MTPNDSQAVCPAHQEILSAWARLAKDVAVQKESIDNLKRSIDAVCDKLDGYGRLLHDMSAAIQRIDGFLNGRKHTDHAVSQAYDRAIATARLITYVIVSVWGLVLGIVKIMPLLKSL